MSLNTTRGTFSYMEGSDLASDIDQGFEDLAQRIADVGVLFSQGVFASRPAAAAWGGGGALYLATDTSVLYYTDGAAWYDFQDLLPPTEIVNADVAAGAAISYSKLDLALGIVNADINAAAAIVYSKLNLTNGIVNADINSSAGIVDTKLASPNNSTYKQLDRVKFMFGAVGAAGTYMITDNGYLATGTLLAGAGDVSNTLRLDSSDLDVAGLSTKLRVKVAISTGGTALGTPITFGLYPLTTVAAPAGQIGQNLGVVVAGSTVAFASPGTVNTLTGGNSGDFSYPGDGYYALGFVLTGAATVNSKIMVDCVLEVRNV